MILSIARKASIEAPKIQSKPLPVANQKKSFSDYIPKDPYKAVTQLSTRLTTQATISPQELLIYQVRAGELGMHVELVSKVGESVSASLRKLQQQG